MVRIFRHVTKNCVVVVPLPPEAAGVPNRNRSMKPLNHSANQGTEGLTRPAAKTRDSHMPDGKQQAADNRAMRSQLLKMIVENERRRTQASQTIVQH